MICHIYDVWFQNISDYDIFCFIISDFSSNSLDYSIPSEIESALREALATTFMQDSFDEWKENGDNYECLKDAVEDNIITIKMVWSRHTDVLLNIIRNQQYDIVWINT